MLFQELGDKEYTVECVEQFAAIAEAQGRADRATRLLSVCEKLRTTIGLARNASDRTEYEARVARLRAQLGETTFAETWAAGQSMTLEQVVADVLDESSHS